MIRLCHGSSITKIFSRQLQHFSADTRAKQGLQILQQTGIPDPEGRDPFFPFIPQSDLTLLGTIVMLFVKGMPFLLPGWTQRELIPKDLCEQQLLGAAHRSEPEE